ncbi:DUF3221 domain-containing protein [Halobacillus fulvus]|nr:DUF3221 domain-containing protein [Halobacillus fulvus]
MKTVGLMFISFLLLLSACGSAEPSLSGEADSETQRSPDITGYVMDQQDDQILVVTPKDPASSGTMRAVWVSDAADDLWIGKQVEVWLDGPVQESFPEQGKAEQVAVLEMSDVDGADLQVTEALSSVLSSVASEDILSVDLISFDPDADEWTVKLTELGTGSHLKEIIADKK